MSLTSSQLSVIEKRPATIMCAMNVEASPTSTGLAGASAGVSEGSKGAIGMVLRVHDTTLLAINCHLAKHDVERRREQYGLLCRMLGEGLALPGMLAAYVVRRQRALTRSTLRLLFRGYRPSAWWFEVCIHHQKRSDHFHVNLHDQK